MRRRVRWHDRRNGSSSGSALRLVRTSSARLRRNRWTGLSNESETSREGPRASASRRQWKNWLGIMLGWRGYFGFCETPEVLIALTRWVRLRLRAAFWRQWKTPRRRRAALIALGVSGQLRNMAGSGRGPWHLARSKALSVGLSNAYFKSLGLPSLIKAG